MFYPQKAWGRRMKIYSRVNGKKRFVEKWMEMPCLLGLYKKSGFQ
jgi:hypothetical protein